MMTAWFISLVVLALFVVGVGEARDLRRRRRLAEAGRSRMPAPPPRARLRA